MLQPNIYRDRVLNFSVNLTTPNGIICVSARITLDKGIEKYLNSALVPDFKAKAWNIQTTMMENNLWITVQWA